MAKITQIKFETCKKFNVK